MIIDSLDNWQQYFGEGAISEAFAFLLTLDANSPEGKTEIRGQEIYVSIDGYQTKPETECRLEAHRRYIDIQMMLSGSEIIGWQPIHDLKTNIPYDSDKDVEFFLPAENPPNRVIMQPGMFMLLYPEDAHMPQIAVVDNPQMVKKVVAKISVEAAG